MTPSLTNSSPNSGFPGGTPTDRSIPAGSRPISAHRWSKTDDLCAKVSGFPKLCQASACRATIRVVERSGPVPASQAIYDRLYPVYRALYPALKEPFAAVAKIYE